MTFFHSAILWDILSKKIVHYLATISMVIIRIKVTINLRTVLKHQIKTLLKYNIKHFYMKCYITYGDFVSHPSGLRGHRQSKPRRGTTGRSESKEHSMDVPTVSVLVNSCASYHKYFHIHLYLIHLSYSDLFLIFSQISYI